MSDDDKARVVVCCHIMRKTLGTLAEANQPIEPFVFFEVRSQVNRFGFDVIPQGILAENFSKIRLPFTPMSKAAPTVQEAAVRMAKQIADGDCKALR